MSTLGPLFKKDILATYRTDFDKEMIKIKYDKKMKATVRVDLLKIIGGSNTYIDDVLSRLGNESVYKHILVHANSKKDTTNYSDITPDIIQKLSKVLQDKNIKIIYNDEIIDKTEYDPSKPIVFLYIKKESKRVPDEDNKMNVSILYFGYDEKLIEDNIISEGDSFGIELHVLKPEEDDDSAEISIKTDVPEPIATSKDVSDPESVEPKSPLASTEMASVEPESVEPEPKSPLVSTKMESVEPESVEPESVEPESVEPESVETEPKPQMKVTEESAPKLDAMYTDHVRFDAGTELNKITIKKKTKEGELNVIEGSFLIGSLFTIKDVEYENIYKEISNSRKYQLAGRHNKNDGTIMWFDIM